MNIKITFLEFVPSIPKKDIPSAVTKMIIAHYFNGGDIDNLSPEQVAENYLRHLQHVEDVTLAKFRIGENNG